MSFYKSNDTSSSGPTPADVEQALGALETEEIDEGMVRYARLTEGAIAFVHFDPNSAKGGIVEALVHRDDLEDVHRGLYVSIISTNDGRNYMGRVVDGPFYSPDTLKRDSTPVQFIILNQGQAKSLTVPEYHGTVFIEILGEERDGVSMGATHRPHPASPVFAYDSTMMSEMLKLNGDIRLGTLDNYKNVFAQIDSTNKNIARNWLTGGTVGSGKSNTDQVVIEETLEAGFAQVVIDPEGEYVFMDEPSDAPGVTEDLAKYGRKPQGVKSITVYRPPKAESKRPDAKEFSVPFDSLSQEVISEITEMSSAQQTRFTFLYEQAIRILRKERGKTSLSDEDDDLDVSRGYPGLKLAMLIKMLDQEFEYYDWKRAKKPEKSKAKKRSSKKTDDDLDNDDNDGDDTEVPKLEIYCHKYGLPPLIQDYQDVSSYGALRKKLRELSMMRIFDRKDAPPLNMEELSRSGHLTVIDMSDSREQQVVNIVIADLLARIFIFKMSLTEEENVKRKIFLTIEEAHSFVSRERQDKMEQTLDQLRRIARRGRKRWFILHFVTQSPQHLPSELFELANNKIIHQTNGSENLRVLKAAAGTINEAIWNDVPSLGRGRAVVVAAQYPHPIIVQMRPAASKRNYMI
jgi:DNA helicase HerA-like ATPase